LKLTFFLDASKELNTLTHIWPVHENLDPRIIIWKRIKPSNRTFFTKILSEFPLKENELIISGWDEFIATEASLRGSRSIRILPFQGFSQFKGQLSFWKLRFAPLPYWVIFHLMFQNNDILIALIKMTFYWISLSKLLRFFLKASSNESEYLTTIKLVWLIELAGQELQFEKETKSFSFILVSNKFWIIFEAFFTLSNFSL